MQRCSFPGLTNAWIMPIKTRIDMLATGIKTPVGIKVAGPDLAQIEAIGRDIERVLNERARHASPPIPSASAPGATSRSSRSGWRRPGWV